MVSAQCGTAVTHRPLLINKPFFRGFGHSLPSRALTQRKGQVAFYEHCVTMMKPSTLAARPCLL